MPSNLDPNKSGSWDTRGHIYFLMGDYDQALADYEEAYRLSQRTKRSPALAGQAVVQYVLGNHDKARDLWAQVIAEKEEYRDLSEFYYEFAPAEQFMDIIREIAS